VQTALSPDGQRAAAQGEQSDTVVLADLTVPGKPTTRLTNGDGAVSALSFDPVDGQLLATAGTSAITIWALDDESIKARVPLKDGMRAAGVAVNRDGSMVATYDSAGNAYLSNTASGTTLTLPERAVRAITFSADGRWVGITTDTDIRLWDIAAQQEAPVHLVASVGVGSNPSPVRFSPDGKYLAAPRVLDGYFRTSVWQIDDGELVGDVAGYANDAAFLPDEQRLVVSGSNGLSITRFDPSSAVNTICRIVGRDLTVGEWNQYASVGLNRVSACP
jgi:WD40 repeat protein